MMAAPDRILWLDETDSTNEEAKRRAQAGEAGPLWIAARRQTSGRGRRGRAWDSEDGNLFCTLLLRTDEAPTRVAQLAFAAGLAVADAAARWVDPAAIRLKWPNDTLIGGGKAAGCLLEAGADAQGRFVAVGVGLNLVRAPDVASAPAAAQARALYPATSIAAHLAPGAQAPAPAAALAALAATFANWRDLWAREGFAPLRDGFLARAAGLGGPVVARLADGSELAGDFTDLDADGALVLRAADGALRRVSAADVHFPKAPVP